LNDLLFAIGVLVLGVLALSMASNRFAEQERPYIWLSFVAHAVGALAMIVVVRQVFEGGDMLAYHNVGMIIADQFRAAPSDTAGMVFDLLVHKREPIPIPGTLPGSSTGSMQALAALLALLFNGSLFASTLAIAFGAFFAKLGIFSVFRRELPELSARAVAIPCLLLPSVVFWSSGILKESFAIIGLGALLSGAYSIANGKPSLRSVLFVAMGGLLVAALKPHILPPLSAAIGAWVAVRRPRSADAGPTTSRGMIVGGVVAIAVVLATGVFFQRFAPDQLAEEVAHMQEVGANTPGGSQYALLNNPNASLATQLALVPLALITALFRPALFEARTFLVGVNALEVTAFTWMFLVAVFRNRGFGIVRRIASSPALTFCAFFVVSFGIGVGLTTTNLGTLSRYRMPLVPFFGLLLMALVRTRQVATAEVAALGRESHA
jgi:hypothetical protein